MDDAELVEKMAKAICNAHSRDYDRLTDAKNWWREEATAALAVIREAGRLKEADQPE